MRYFFVRRNMFSDRQNLFNHCTRWCFDAKARVYRLTTIYSFVLLRFLLGSDVDFVVHSNSILRLSSFILICEAQIQYSNTLIPHTTPPNMIPSILTMSRCGQRTQRKSHLIHSLPNLANQNPCIALHVNIHTNAMQVILLPRNDRHE